MPVLMRPWGHCHYQAQGAAQGGAVILIHGLGLDLRMWQAVVPGLPGHRCIALDLRGHGLSATPTEAWTLADLADDVAALMDHLGLTQAMVVGCSLGGMVAQVVGLRHPGRVAGLVLSNTAARIGTADSWAERVAVIEAGGIAAVAEIMLDRWFAPGLRHAPEALPWRVLLLRADPQGYIATSRVLAAADLRAEVGSIRVPVLVLAGTADGATPEALVRETAALIPGARFELLEGSGHLPAIDAPGRVVELLRDHAARCGLSEAATGPGRAAR